MSTDAELKARHTPGPWSADMNDESVYGIPIIAAFGADGRPDEAPHIGNVWGEANARLIAAAPELLEALRKIVAVIDREPDRECGAAALQIARAAITRATQGAGEP